MLHFRSDFFRSDTVSKWFIFLRICFEVKNFDMAHFPKWLIYKVTHSQSDRFPILSILMISEVTYFGSAFSITHFRGKNFRSGPFFELVQLWIGRFLNLSIFNAFPKWRIFVVIYIEVTHSRSDEFQNDLLRKWQIFDVIFFSLMHFWSDFF